MIHAVLPGMRKRRKGFIVNFSSISGLRSFPSVGYYNATKFAVEGLSEALWQEVESLGIKVMLVEPNGFRTDWGRAFSGRKQTTDRRLCGDGGCMAQASARHLRQISGIAISGYGMEEDIARSYQAGFIEHLVKPVSISELRRVLSKVDFSKLKTGLPN